MRLRHCSCGKLAPVTCRYIHDQSIVIVNPLFSATLSTPGFTNQSPTDWQTTKKIEVRVTAYTVDDILVVDSMSEVNTAFVVFSTFFKGEPSASAAVPVRP